MERSDERRGRTPAFLFLLCCCSAFGARTKLFSTNGNNDAEDGIFKSMVEKRGYVTTQDGFILSTLRIPQDHAGGKNGAKPPVLLQHGLLMGTLISLAAFSQEQLLSMPISAVMLCLIAHMGNITSPPARNAAEKFIAELNFSKRFANSQVLTALNCLPPSEQLKKSSMIDDLPFPYKLMTGQNYCLYSSVINVFLENESQPTSTKITIHLAQSE
ncbi:AB-hydrolase lipase domain [Dillenia turbinata]|uniref:AB-hydrolase lipase domain n=1 Tax=Dillenia turbinata TaxID=194707 RepID=A0AAN8UWG8_9MAGN